MTNEALKIQNQPTIDLFREVLGDLAPLAEFMPRTSNDIINYISYWETKLRNPITGTWTEKECKDQIKKLEKIMMAGTELASELLNNVTIIKEKEAEHVYPETVEDSSRSKLPTFQEVREEIANLFKTKGKDEAEKYGRVFLRKNNHREGNPIMPEAVTGIINEVINEVIASKAPAKTETPKPEKKTEPADTFAELKKRFPSLSEKITDEECLLIDTYEKTIMKKEWAQKKEEDRIFDLAKQKWLLLNKEERDKISKKAMPEYDKLPSEDKATMTEESFTISYYGSTLKFNPLAPIIDFCATKDVIEDERKAMKELQNMATELIANNEHVKAGVLAKLFFGNFKQVSLPIQRGRAWSDAEVAFWLKWAHDGFAEGEWHLYQTKVKTEDDARDKEVVEVQKKRDEIKNEKLEMPEQLKAQIVEVIESNLKNKVPFNDTINQCKILYKEHDHEWHATELKTLYTHVKSSVEIPDKEISIPLPESNKDKKVFIRVPVKKSNPTLWEEARDIKSMGDLFHFIDNHKDLDWKETLNLSFDIRDSGRIKAVEQWSDARIEDWYHRTVEKTKAATTKKEENPVNKEVFASPVIEIPELEPDLTNLGKFVSQNRFKKEMGKFLKKHGTTLEIKDAISNKWTTFINGWPKTFANQTRSEKFNFINGVIRWMKLDDASPALT